MSPLRSTPSKRERANRSSSSTTKTIHRTDRIVLAQIVVYLTAQETKALTAVMTKRTKRSHRILGPIRQRNQSLMAFSHVFTQPAVKSSDPRALSRDFRFGTESGIKSDIAPCPFGAPILLQKSVDELKAFENNDL